MSSSKQHILFVSHRATRSGAPVLLLDIIREMKRQENISFSILLQYDGDLADEFRKLGKTYVWNDIRQKASHSITGRIIGRLNRILSRIRKRSLIAQLRKPTIVFSNTITTGEIQRELLKFSPKFICYVHELEMAIHQATNQADLNTVLSNTHVFITGSEAVRNNLISNHKVNPSSVQIVHYPVPASSRNKKDYVTAAAEFRILNKIPSNAVIAGIAANAEWRKGFDLFPQLVKLYQQIFPGDEVYFVWLGVKKSNGEFDTTMYDHKKYQLKNTILIPHGPDYFNYLACFDIHLLLSREDPYPLVVLDAAAFCIPTICFQDAGGTPEFVEENGGYNIPYGNLFEMANKIHLLSTDIELRHDTGQIVKQKVYTKHDSKQQTRRLLNLIKSIT